MTLGAGGTLLIVCLALAMGLGGGLLAWRTARRSDVETRHELPVAVAMRHAAVQSRVIPDLGRITVAAAAPQADAIGLEGMLAAASASGQLSQPTPSHPSAARAARIIDADAMEILPPPRDGAPMRDGARLSDDLALAAAQLRAAAAHSFRHKV